jgi:secondary thiamine-phosphate synthase enzyme
MKQHSATLTFQTRGPGLADITREVERALAKADIGEGLLTLFIRHTSASFIVQENADPDVPHDLEHFLRRIVGRDMALYRHNAEGPDDMPAHIRSALTQTSLSIPVRDGEMVLGTWQGIYLWEHRDQPHTREIAVHVMGE